MTRILCLWLANWPIQRIVRSRPELKGQAVALAASGGHPRAHGTRISRVPGRGSAGCRVGGAQVALCSSAAVAQGVRVGMPLAEAQALAPQLVVLPHEPLRDREALAKLAEACEWFSPCVGLEEAVEPESLLLDISNLEHLWGSEAALVEQVEKFFKRRGYRVRLAVAETIGLAWALSHFAAGEVAAATGKDDFGSKLPIEALRISADAAALLRELGIETIDQLRLLPREGLTSRFGDELLRRLDQLTDAASEVVMPHRGLPGLEAAHSLDEPTADRALLTHVLAQLVERLSRQLAARDQGAVLLACLLRCTGGNIVPLQIGLLQPTASARQLMELIELNLETVRLAGEVDRVEVRVAVTGRLGERQGELFADRWSSDPHQLALLINRLSSRLGQEQVLRAELSASPVPERAVGWKPMAGQPIQKLQNAKCKLQNANWQGRRRRPLSKIDNLQFRAGHPAAGFAGCRVAGGWSCNLQSAPRPLLLHPQPQPLEVVCIAPDGPPQFVWLAGRRQRVVHHAGPERIETLWWRGESVRRDYYRVALESGSHLWIFRRLTDRRWFLHGAFA